MKRNPLSMVGIEAIDYQNGELFRSLVDIFNRLKQNILTFEGSVDEIQRVVKKSMNLTIKFKWEDESYVNAYACPIVLSEQNTLLATWGGRVLLPLTQRNKMMNARGTMVKIAKGEYPATGELDYKRARVSGIFEKIPVEVGMSKPFLKYSAEAMAGAILHELGHVWTFFEFLGLYTFRNAIISNTVNEYLNCKDEKEKFQFIIATKNIWGLEMDEKIAQLDDETATKVIAGGMINNFKDGVGYVQYDQNTAEVIADQFAVRMGSSPDIFETLGDLSINAIRAANRNDNFEIMKTVFGAVVSVVSSVIVAPLALPMVIIATGISFLLPVMAAKVANGSTYDNGYERYIRAMYEEIGRLKKRDIPPEIMKMVLDNLLRYRKVIEKAPKIDNLTQKIARWFSSDFREQEKKMKYQQLTEELLANELYIHSATLKTL